jgi:DNA-binding GntR family transcriptional regulator
MSIDGSDRTTSHLEELAARLTNGYKTIGEMVYEVIHEAIVAGMFAPGERLRQEALATAIGVSRIPVRSALLQLESEGLVDFHPRRGAVVRSLSTEQLREIYELREVLEPYALKKSLPTMTPDRIARLRELAVSLDDEHEGADFLDLRITFYRELYNVDLNPQLVKIIEELRSAVGRYLLGWRVAQTHDHSHASLVDAVEAGDLKGATKVLLAHLEQVRHGLETMIAQSREAAEARLA